MWATRFMSLGGRLAQLVAVWATPRISSIFGWRTVCYVYGAATAGFMCLWHIFATDSPADNEIFLPKTPQQLQCVPAASSVKKEQPKAVEWGVFRVGPVNYLFR